MDADISQLSIEPEWPREDRRAAVKKAVGYLSRREHSACELSRKLERSGFDGSLVGHVMSELQAHGLQSDCRFAEAYVRYRGSRGFGPARIHKELADKGVSSALVAEVMAGSGWDWYVQAASVRTKKFGDNRPEDYKERARQARFLQYRGFAGEQINYALGGED